jgi:hypothetical protein
MNFFLLNATSNVSVTDVDLPIMVVAQLVIFVGSLVGFWYNIKNKTAMNTRLNKELKEKLVEHVSDSEKKIDSYKQNCDEAYTKLENKICNIEKEVNTITVGIANIEGYMKAMCDKNKK